MFEDIKPIKFNSSEVKIWFTSDLHFNHQNIIKFCNRPWKTTEEMDYALIDNWNSVVGKDDIVFNLGDFAFAPNHKWKEYIEALNGIQYLIMGNHDRSRYPGDTIMKLFHSIHQQLILKIDGQTVYLNHFPFLCMDGVYSNTPVFALHGHVHLNKVNNTGKDFDRMKMVLPNQYDVGVDFNDYKPISWEELHKKIYFQIEHKVNELHWLNEKG